MSFCSRPIFLALVTLCTLSCAARAPIPTGTIPEAKVVSQADHEYGQEVLRQLSTQYPITYDRSHSDRVLRIVERLAKAVGTQAIDWNVYILDDLNVANAAATRGNYIFVWTGMLDAVPNDSELAAVLSHEIAHVLAEHTHATPDEEVSQIATGLAGEAVGQYLGAIQGGAVGQLAQSLVTEILKGFIVNPEAQRKEYEADEVGLFTMARAGYNPRASIAFWERANKDPRFAGGMPQFFSSHPSSESRLQRLRELLPEVERQGR